MRAAGGMHVEWVDDEAIVLDPETGQLHYLNPAAALTYALIAEHGYERALEDLAQKYETNQEFDRALPDLVEMLIDKGLLIRD